MMNHFWIFLNVVFFYFILSLEGLSDPLKQTPLLQEDQQISQESEEILPLYQLREGENWREITDQVLANPETSQAARELILAHHRRIILFKYPSDHLWIKGFISFTPHPNYHSLLILFRGGNRQFGLMNPGIGLATYGDYTVVSSALRGGVSEGRDEFGGADVDDIKNLIDFLPQLAEELGIQLHPRCLYMLGPSRGGLEMFLTLARYPKLQNRITKIVALSSILDLHDQILHRPKDMKPMFIHDFGLKEGVNDQQWIARRDPLQTVPYLRKSLPILIIQGTADRRVRLTEGYRIIEALRKSGHDVHYWEVKGGDHTLSNDPHLMSDITRWLGNCLSTLY